jgi:hypothetical protein
MTLGFIAGPLAFVSGPLAFQYVQGAAAAAFNAAWNLGANVVIQSVVMA